MKKLSVFERWNGRYSYVLETVTAKIGDQTVNAMWLWDGGLDYAACCSFFHMNKDIITNLETPIMSRKDKDILAQIFIAGCSYGNTLDKGGVETDELLSIEL